MRLKPLACVLLLVGFAACSDKGTTIVPEDSGLDDGGGDDGGDDGGDEGTDEDGDGVTVEDGDCDDDDYQVNPLWDEDPYDEKDNDCDGRVDEVWGGMAVAEQYGEGRSTIRVLSSVGGEDASIVLPSGVVPWNLTQGGDADWYVTTYPYFASISGPTSFVSGGLMPSWDDSVPWYQPSVIQRVQESGTVTEFTRFGDAEYDACFELPEEEVPDCFGELAPRLYFFGPYVRSVAWHPEGWLAVLLPGQLMRVESDGSSSELAAWGWNYSAETYEYELYGTGLDVDPLTGTLGISGLLGGFATWHADDGLVVHKATDLSETLDLEALYTTVGTSWMDGDGFYAISAQFTTGEYAIRRFNLDTGEWEESVRWLDDLMQPLDLTTDGDQGDWYVTSKVGDHRNIFRVRGVDSSIDDLMDEVADDYNLWGVANRY